MCLWVIQATVFTVYAGAVWLYGVFHMNFLCPYDGYVFIHNMPMKLLFGGEQHILQFKLQAVLKEF